MPLLLTAPKLRRPKALDAVLRTIRTEYDVPAVKAAVLALWAEANGVAIDRLAEAWGAGHYLVHLDEQAVDMLRGATDVRQFAKLSEVEESFERLVADDMRKENGIVYTPDFISAHLIHEGFKLGGVDPRRATFCDTCCGGASFVLRAAEFFHQHAELSYEAALRERIWGFDLSRSAVDDTQCLAEMFLLSRAGIVVKERLNFHECDAFSADAANTLQRVGRPDGFDLVATNPPYVKLQNLPESYRRFLAERYPGLTNGSYSLAMLFLVGAQQWLSKRGMLAVITQNNIFSSLAGEAVRRKLQLDRSVHRIVDFGHNRVFAQASAYTCLVFCGKQPADEIEFDAIRGPVSSATLEQREFARVPIATLDPVKWRLASRSDLENLRRIEDAGIQLGDLCDIRVGFATLKDSVFLVREENGICWALAPDGQSIEIERGITRGAVKIASLETESELASNSLRIICPYERRGARHRLLEEPHLAALYPKAYEYLSMWKTELAQRDKGRKSYDGWYAWGRTQGMEAPGPKLLTKTFSRGPNFMRDESDRLFCNGYAVFPPKSSLFGPKISLSALQLILNSRVMFYYTRLTSFQIEGGFECYQKNFIERFGLPMLSGEDCSRLEVCGQTEADNLLIVRYGLDAAAVDEITSPVGP